MAGKNCDAANIWNGIQKDAKMLVENQCCGVEKRRANKGYHLAHTDNSNEAAVQQQPNQFLDPAEPTTSGRRSERSLVPISKITANGEREEIMLRSYLISFLTVRPPTACINSFFEKGCPRKPYATLSEGIMGNRGSWSLIEALGVSATQGVRCFSGTNKCVYAFFSLVSKHG